MKSSKRARVLLDTSTLFSALGWSGAPFEVLMKINEKSFDLVLTDYILDELSDHFRDFSPERREHALESLEHLEEASVVEESEWEENLSRAEELVGRARTPDNGGISDEDENKIFERGFKSGDTGGSGLGMYLVKQIVESYDGSIEVKDSELGGAKFDVHLQKA